MALYPFYSDYKIDDAQIDCWKVITVNCDWVHQYSSICDLMKDCIWNMINPIHKQCVIDFFNTTIDTIPSWYYLHVTANGCIGASELPPYINSDEKVKVKLDDSTWYLEWKIIGKIWTYTIAVNTVGSPGARRLEISCAGPESPRDWIWDPDCDGAYVRANTDWTWYYDCDGNWDNDYRAERYASDDIIISSWTNKYRSYVFTTNGLANRTWVSPAINVPWAGPLSKFRGKASMNTSDAIRIEKTGMYNVWMKGEAIVNRWVCRIRLFIVVKNAITGNCRLLIDSKYGNEDSWGYTTNGIAMPPFYEDSATGSILIMPAKTVTLNWNSLLMLEAGDVVMLWCKIDARYTNSVTPNVVWRDTVYELTDQDPGTPITEVSNTWPWLSYGVSRATPFTHWFTY